jgi:hypothetical protein
VTSRDYEMALLALRSWQASKSDSLDEVLAIACVFRNRVLKWGKTYTQVLEEAEVNRGWPDIRHPAMIDPNNGLLAAVEGIYKNETPDLTSNHLHKNGCLWFMRAVDHHGTGDWMDENILKNQAEHGLVGTWGIQQFYE